MQVEVGLASSLAKTKLVIACDVQNDNNWLESEPFYVQVKDCASSFSTNTLSQASKKWTQLETHPDTFRNDYSLPLTTFIQ